MTSPRDPGRHRDGWGVAFERDAEEAAVREKIANLGTAGSLLYVEGPAGIGKTLVLERAVEIASEHELSVFRARGSELEQALAYSTVRQLFSRHLREMPVPRRDELLAGAAAWAAPVLGVAGPDRRGLGEDVLEQTLHGLFWLCADLIADSPTLLAIDDLHWVDEPSLRFISYLAARVEDLPLLLAVAARPAQPGTTEALLDDILRSPACRRLGLEPLSADATHRGVRSRFPAAEAEFGSACHELSGGNPFLLGELLTAAEEQGVPPTAAGASRLPTTSSDSLSRSTQSRVRRCGDAAERLATVLAVFPAGAALRQVARLADLTVQESAAAVDTLTANHVLDDARPLDFAHPLLRSALYESIPAARRAQLHGRAARLLIAEGAQPDEIVFHLLRSEPAADAGAAQTLARAAEAALRDGAYEEALRYSRRALEEPPPPDERVHVMLRMGAAEGQLGIESALERMREAAALAAQPRLRAEILQQLGWSLMTAGHFVEAGAALTEALDVLPANERETALVIEASLVAAAQMEMLAPELIQAHLAAHDPAKLTGATYGERCILGVLAFEAVRSNADAAIANDLAERALPLGVAPGTVADSPPLFLGTLALIYAEGFAHASRVIERELAYARQRGSRRGVSVLGMLRIILVGRVGNLRDGAADATEILEMRGALQTATGLSTAALLAEMAIERGELPRAREQLADAGVLAQPAEEVLFEQLLYVRARFALAAGRPDDALADLLACGERLTGRDSVSPAVMPWRSQAAMALAQLGDAGRAQELAGEELELARAFGAPRALGVSLRVAALVSSSPAERLGLLEGSVGVLRESDAILERARALADLGAELRRQNRRAEARGLLREALDLAHQLGALALVDSAREELIAGGGRPRRVAQRGIDSLTPSEHRVAKLAADGRSNREIAQALFISQKTVEMHLRNAYGKLEIASRGELPGLLAV